MANDAAREAWGYVTTLLLGPEMQARLQETCDAVGVPHPGALRLLMNLRPHDPPSMREVAGFLHCDASYVTALVDALEARGYVERRVSPADRRVKLLRLTSTGEAARARAMEVLSTPPEPLKRLTAAEARTLAALLRKAAQG